MSEGASIIGKKVLAFLGEFRYSGVLLEEDEQTWTIDDVKHGCMKLPKAATVLKVEQ